MIWAGRLRSHSEWLLSPWAACPAVEVPPSELLGAGGIWRLGLETPWLIDAGWRLAWPGAMLKGFFEPHLFLTATEDESVLIQRLVLQTVKKSKFVAC